jgi:hypothetical protein
MKKLALAFSLAFATIAPAAVMNVEFKFTPFSGDPARDKEVTMVPGKAEVFINNVPIAEEELREEKLAITPESHDVGPGVAVPISSAGSVVRKGKNKFRLEFRPNDAAKFYDAQLRWSFLSDQPTHDLGPDGSGSLTNEGVDDRKSTKGKVVFERDFTAAFALDFPWHHYPAVTSLTEDDKKKIVALLQARVAWFQPNFSALYKAIEDDESLKADDVRKAQCLEAAYKAGVRVSAPQAGELNFTMTGGPEVMVARENGTLFGLDEKTFAGVQDEETQACASVVLASVYPGRIGAVHKPDGAWEIVD